MGPLEKLRAFLSYPQCSVALDLHVGKTYLFMGTSKDIHKDKQTWGFAERTDGTATAYTSLPHKQLVCQLVLSHRYHSHSGSLNTTRPGLTSLTVLCPQVSVCHRWEHVGGILAQWRGVSDWRFQRYLHWHQRDGAAVLILWMSAEVKVCVCVCFEVLQPW